MHIPDAYLSPATEAAAYAAMIPIWTIATRKTVRSLTTKQAPLLSIGAAFCFAIQMFNIPAVGGTTAHALGAALLAILVGPWAAVLGMTLTLTVQALLFGDGGILSLGANCFDMGLVACFVSYGLFRLLRGSSSSSTRSIVAAGFSAYIGTVTASLCAGIFLGIQPIIAHDAAGHALYCPFGLNVSVPAMVMSHLLVAGPAEAIITVASLAYLWRTFPEFTPSSAASRPKVGSGLRLVRRLVWVLVLTPIGLIASGSAFGEWDVDELAKLVGYTPSGLAKAHEVVHPLLPDYGFRGLESTPWAIAGYLASALIGCAVIALFTRSLLRPTRASGSGVAFESGRAAARPDQTQEKAFLQGCCAPLDPADRTYVGQTPSATTLGKAHGMKAGHDLTPDGSRTIAWGRRNQEGGDPNVPTPEGSRTLAWGRRPQEGGEANVPTPEGSRTLAWGRRPQEGGEANVPTPEGSRNRTNPGREIPDWLTLPNPATAANRPKTKNKNWLENTLLKMRSTVAKTVASEEIARRPGLLQSIDPLAKTIGFLCALIATGLSQSLWQLMAFFAIALIAAKLSRVDLKPFVLNIAGSVAFFGLVLAIPLSLQSVTSGPTAFTIAGIAVSSTGLHAAEMILLRLASGIGLAMLWNLTTRWNRLIQSLQSLGISRMFLTTAALTYRYLFVMMETLAEMVEARTSRQVGACDKKQARTYAGNGAAILFAKSLAFTEEMHMAMQARDLSAKTSHTRPKWQAADIGAMLAGFLFIALIVLQGHPHAF